MVQLLLTEGANPDGDRRASHCPLIVAAVDGRFDLVQTLYCCGADLNLRDEDGDPAIHSVAIQGNMDMVKLILGISDDTLDFQGTSGRPAWWFAQKYGHTAVMELLRETMQKRQKRPLREFSPDIDDDSGQQFDEIGLNKLLGDTTRAQQYAYRTQDPSKPEMWKERIRFIIKAEEGEDHDFEVIEPYRDGKDSLEPFVAVSYCWASHENTGKLRIKVPKKDGSGPMIRPTRASTQVILRSLEFAHSKGIKRVWIDQECIHQDDSDDKRLLVGTMHRLYRQATLTLAILGNHIQSVDDIEAIKDLYDTTGRPHVEILRNRIFNDRWFKRSWTTQEAISATRDNMVYLIGWESDLDSSNIHWKQMAASLSKAFPRQTVSRELILDGSNKWSLSFHIFDGGMAMTNSFMERSVASTGSFTLCSFDIKHHPWYASSEGDWAIANKISQKLLPTAVSISNSIATLFGFSGKEEYTRRCDVDQSNHKHSLSDVSRTDHHAISIIGALSSLKGKRNLKTIDRLSILANLARYEYHLDIAAILEKEPKISYSACILALAFINGDLSLLTDLRFLDPADSHNIEPSWLMPNTWLAESQNQIELMPRHTFTGKITGIGNPCIVMEDKLLARGVLWKIESYESLLPLQKGIRSCLDSCQKNKLLRRRAGLEVLKATVKQLFVTGNDSLVPLVVILARKDKWESPAEVRSTVQQLQNWHQKGGSWPCQIHPDYGFGGSGNKQGEDSVEYDKPFDTNVFENAEFQQDSTPLTDEVLEKIIPTDWGIGLLRWIYLTIYFGVPLALGRYQLQHEGEDDDVDEYAIFKLNPKKSKMVFVPLGELNYEFNGGLHFEVSSVKDLFWCVQERHEHTVPIEEVHRRLNELDQSDRPIADGALSIEQSKDLEGCWSPMLCSNGVLKWDDKLRSYHMTTPKDFASYRIFV
ncbi:heterokaryon incompatibility protein-domain-containing protein [Annulohypoxylon maeteangense]|uniref:heterokaryon incompatibility protein-domain-containing protein n=1 Tax=Annulohypoxylon maeteangense TaxID=1927788 RepID=UPI002007AC2F|nr:heterokaryon incompatibility protein-domain-containing protein [Annulohypoxylon maeteangense]KAI0888961.1 heterokaryon incompatibility protein-domain-containing protein [Annulohypoxylon maeteangense]